MKYEIKRYTVQNPILKNYVKFFWEIHAEYAQVNHKIIPVRNIDLKFNLNDTPHYVVSNNKEKLLENVYFSGLQDHYTNAYIEINGKVDILGVCFLPEGFFPFFKIPVSEFKNQLFGAREVGINIISIICEKLKEAPDVTARLNIIEYELVMLFDNLSHTSKNFHKVFNAFKQNENVLPISEFCKRNNISIRKLERMYNRYIGISAKSYITLNRFQNSLNQLLYDDYSKLSDIAYSNGYFDQVHFIKEFKRFTGNSPKSFARHNNSMLQIGKFS